MEEHIVRVTAFEGRRHFEGWPSNNLQQFASWASEMLESIPPECRAKAKIDIGAEVEYDVADPCISVTYERPETEAERAEREAAWQARIEAQVEKEKRYLASLLQKYGPPN